MFYQKKKMEHHQQHYHQVGGAINNDQKATKRKLEDDSGKEAKKKEFRAKVDGFFTAGKEVSTMKGAKVDAFFYPKTEGQKTDQQVFFKETLPRLEQRLKDALAEKKGLKWNLVYHCTLSMPSKYRSDQV